MAIPVGKWVIFLFFLCIVLFLFFLFLFFSVSVKSLSMGISDEIEDATIAIDEMKISEIEATK